MSMHIIIWVLLAVIGVSDAQRHRIPNQLVGLLACAVLADIYMQGSEVLGSHIQGLLTTFAICFGLYLLRVMAGGDVKLLATVGLWVGIDVMGEVSLYIVVAGGLIALFYLALHVACSTIPFTQQVKGYAVQKVTPGWKSKQPLVIPFAPAIVIGLAYYFYIH
ncbi:peptidase A24 [Vibrio mytili]|uniref:Peptidase A24 n=2 Tax=Vibrio mytili TaxID=50718 RepID=A0A0C3I5K0_9VIBR|nr:prepilin peptidase [Vibrio mytili]KIN10315.1 peptidase A24 [Vibrio mytili]